MKYWLVGIKGTGMSSLAIILKDLGNEVVGSDKDEYFFTQENLDKNKIKYNDFSSSLQDDYFYIVSSSYDENNIHLKTIIEKGYQWLYYYEFIEKYFEGAKIGVCGSHGKTTTTSLCAKMLEDEKVVYLIGNSTGKGVKDYKYFLFEACEYKEHFLNYTYDYLIINNIDYDHPDYFKTEESYIKAFEKVVNRSKMIICNGDDKNISRIKHSCKVTYGKAGDNDYILYNTKKYCNGHIVDIISRYKEERFFVPLFGLHNIYNFLASYVLINELGIKVDIQKKLYEYKLPKRRMEEKVYKSNIIVNDYAHHPTEIEALIESLKEKYHKEIIIIFQPHTYSRTLSFAKEFENCFAGVNEVYTSPTYRAREEYDSIKERKVANIFKNFKTYTPEIKSYLRSQKNKVIVFLGAGIIDRDIKDIFK